VLWRFPLSDLRSVSVGFFDKNRGSGSVSIFIGPDFNHVQSREWTIIGSVSYWNRYWVYRIKSYRLLLYRGKHILRASLQIGLMTGRVTQDILSTFAPDARAPHDKVGGAGGERRKETNLTPATRWHQDHAVLGHGHQRQMTLHPSTGRKWYQQSTVNHSNVSAHYPVLKLTERASWFVANRLHVPPIAYKLRSPRDLPGVMI